VDTGSELALREQIMHELTVLTAAQGYVTREQLSALRIGSHVRRVIDASRGIWNPRDLQATLSIVSSPDGPYDDHELDGALFRYAYRAGSTAGDNTKLRRAKELQLPMILLRKIEINVYAPVFPVYVIDDDVRARQFVLALDSVVRVLGTSESPPERSYAERIVRQRLHQAEFRGRVLRAYETQCAVCNLRLGRLLEAAHIVADRDDGGDPVVTNGLSLCKIHHAAYDADMIGISPSYVVEVNHGLFEAIDGPMLVHGLQEMHRRPLTVPARRRDQPDADRLALRYQAFRDAG
jgi:putative restriction endonuclease